MPYLCGTVFEVGAGLGTRTKRLATYATRWVAIEPDVGMSETLAEARRSELLPSNVEVLRGGLSALPPDIRADTVLYLDVLEHILADREELHLAAGKLRAGGYLVVLAPAHPALYTPFDRAIGHYRRYKAKTLIRTAPPSLKVIRWRMLDCVGMLASVANRLLLQTSMPSQTQVLFWDRVLVRLSRLLDPVLGYRVGKSVLVVWQKSA